MEKKENNNIVKDKSNKKNKWGFWKPSKKNGSWKEKKVGASHSNPGISISPTPKSVRTGFEEMMEMKKKYQNVPKKQRAEDEDKEVFDNVDQSHPVFSNHLLRPGKMKWKESETALDIKMVKETASNTSIAVSPDLKRKEKEDINQHPRKEREDNSGKGAKKKEDGAALLETKIEKLERENEELRKKLKEVKKILRKRRHVDDHSRELADDVSKQAVRVLTIMKKNQVLDTVLDHKSNKALCSFFRDCEKPTEQIATMVEQAIVRGLKYMTTCSDQIDDPIDNDLRQFICNTCIAKKALLRALFDNPELVPDMWGGGQQKTRKDKNLPENHDNDDNQSSPKEKDGK